MSGKSKLLVNSNIEYQNDILKPYIGPRSFRRDIIDQLRFFGRDYETDEIVARIISHRLVLVYAQSGTGKTSIFNAQIIPTLEKEGLEVLPMTRVRITHTEAVDDSTNNGKKSVIQIENPYIYNALLYIYNSLDENNKLRSKIDTQLLPNLSLFEFLDYYFPKSKDKKGGPIPQVLIFDQLEELFSFYPDKLRGEQQRDFFEQIADSLENNPSLRVVFIIREDYLAQLDPFKSILPEKLRPSFRLERLGHEEAISAIKGPIKNIINNLDEEEVKNIQSEINVLVNDLLKVYAQDSNDKPLELEGEFVEPIYLQIVCLKWWNERTQYKSSVIKKSKSEGSSNVDNALEEFYNKAILTASKQTGINEEDIRKWCENKLITSSGTKSIVHRSASSTGGMDNKVIAELENQYLIRREWRSGAPWYELTHDRLIKPIKDSNNRW